MSAKLAPPKRIVLRDGRSLAYAEYGVPHGAPVFFFHGTSHSRLTRPAEDVLAAFGVRLITIDRPGFGLSSFQPGRTLLDWPDDVLELAEALGTDRFAIAGVCPYVAACGYRIPDHLTRAAIVGGMGPVDSREAIEAMAAERRFLLRVARYAPALLLPLLWLMARDPGRALDREQKSYCESDREILARPDVRKMLLESYSEAARAGVRGHAWELRLYARPWGFRLNDVSVDVDLWHGEEDRSIPAAMARRVAHAIPRCHARILPGEGHFLIFKYWTEILARLAPSGRELGPS